ncbi:DoxX family protein [Nigerium massiliense]|uniref:DoxX family protein n=1 Tax=Nigerium massiliense TaxID=1522317 RepID=UPI0005915F8C|nr:DoxX family protein [Nigerium massiliense]
MSVITVLGRALLGGIFVHGGLNQLKSPGAVAKPLDAARDRYGLAYLPVESEDLVTFNGAAMVAGGTAMALGILPRVAATGLALSLVPTTLVGHPFWDADNDADRRRHQTSFWSNMSVLGGLLIEASRKR